MKRLTDILFSLFGLITFSPLIIICMVLIWLHDRKSPFYIADRTAKGAGSFRMVKLRSMVVGADKSKVDSTAKDDMRITAVGHFIRKTKLDEISQLWNVFKGDMSLVGPRPNVKRETDKYTTEEQTLLSVRPGITDLSSIVFSDEGDILEGSDDPDLLYNQIIRPWKSRLSLLCIEKQSFWLDMTLIALTVQAALSKNSALKHIERMLTRWEADSQLIEVCQRKQLRPMAFPPPGATEVVSA